MARCEECGQDKPLRDEDILAIRLDCYKAAYGVYKDVYGEDPRPSETEYLARFLAGDSHGSLFGVDDDD